MISHSYSGGNCARKLAVVGELDGLVLFEQAQRVSQSHFAVLVMMAVGLAVGGDVHELRLRRCL